MWIRSIAGCVLLRWALQQLLWSLPLWFCTLFYLVWWSFFCFVHSKWSMFSPNRVLLILWFGFTIIITDSQIVTFRILVDLISHDPQSPITWFHFFGLVSLNYLIKSFVTRNYLIKSFVTRSSIITPDLHVAAVDGLFDFGPLRQISLLWETFSCYNVAVEKLFFTYSIRSDQIRWVVRYYTHLMHIICNTNGSIILLCFNYSSVYLILLGSIKLSTMYL